MKRPVPIHISVRYIPLLLAPFLACASGENISPPGGPPDKEAPIIKKTEPADGTINFSSDKIRITFNEYLQESGVSDQIVITPIPERPPEIDWSGKTLEIKFRGPLLENKTYAITIGSGLTDLSGNRFGSPQTVRFATGPMIDSGSIAGLVAGMDRRDAFVFAWILPEDAETFNDTMQYKDVVPDVIAPVGDDGSFSLEGLPPGRYRLMALVDEFADRSYSPGTDAFGLATEDYVVDATYTPVRGVRIRLQPAALDLASPQLFSATSVSPLQTNLRFSEPIDTSAIQTDRFRITVDGTEVPVIDAWQSALNPLIITLRHQELPPNREGGVETFRLLDTVGLVLADTARETTFTTTDKPDTFPPVFQLSVPQNGSIRMTDTLFLKFDEEIQLDRNDSLIWVTDTTAGKGVQYQLERKYPALFHAFALDTTFHTPSAILSVDLRAFRDIGGYSVDSLWQAPVRIKPLQQRGTLQGRLIDSAAEDVPHIILLTSTEDNREYHVQLAKPGDWEIAEIPGGEYRLSAFRDNNDNGEYDYGSLDPYRPGEVFVERSGTVRVRARWTTTGVDVEF
ncbi:MAG: Ig-like domain-containing protein [Chlorobi bacterium]|nr:Ig-like domain-containing protein [Chlorobiota bacterium]